MHTHDPEILFQIVADDVGVKHIVSKYLVVEIEYTDFVLQVE